MSGLHITAAAVLVAEATWLAEVLKGFIAEVCIDIVK
jgi:hypothetical protein